MNNNGALSDHQQARKILKAINLPNQTEELLHIFETHANHLTRICALAKIKNQILCALQQLSTTIPSDTTSHTVEKLFSTAVIRVIKKLRGRSQDEKTQTNLFYHVASLAIRYYFRQQAFHNLIIQVTDLLDGHTARIKPALELFAQIIATIEFSGTDSNNNLPRCRFQRHLTSIHLNSMLLLANFCIQRSILKDGFSLEEAPPEQMFDIRAPEDTMLAAFRLLRKTLCFDWLGEKFNDFQQVWDFSTLVIPTKGTKQSALTQFEKWLKNSDWMRGYQYIYRHCRLITLKLQVLQVIGDMARIHMKFFKNKNNFKVHIENIVFGFIGILQQLQLSRNCEESIQLSLAMGRNLNKLTISGAGSILFQINTNFFRALLASIKRFITEQIIGQQIFNTNLIYYFFKFSQSLLVKSRYEKIPNKFQQIQEKIREICRCYQHYIRTLFNKIAKSPIKTGQSSFYRFDCSRLKDNLNLYQYKQLQIFFMPFRLMKPRYASTITIHELFVYIIARVTRALSLISMFKLEDWEKQLAFSIISQSVQKIDEWFDFTSYRRKVLNRQRLSRGRSLSQDNLPAIRELYEEEIQNEEEYCHILRLTSFIIMDQFCEQKPSFYLKIGGAILKMIALTIQMCYGADLLEKDNKQLKNQQIYNKIQNSLAMCLQVCQKILLRQFERTLMFHLSSNNLKHPFRYRFEFNESQICYPDSCYNSEKSALFDLVKKFIRQKNSPFKIFLTKMHFLLACSYSNLDVQSIVQVSQNKLAINLIYLQTLTFYPTLNVLLQSGYPTLVALIQNILYSLGTHEYSSQQLVNYLQCLRLIVRMNLQDLSEEAMNKLFVSIKYLLPFFGQGLQITEELAEQLQKLKQQLFLNSQEQDIIQLGNQIQRVLSINCVKHEKKQLQQTILSEKQNDVYQTHSQKETNKNTLQQSYQTCLIPVNQSDHHQNLPQQIIQNQTILHERPNQIYNGCHRQKTLQILQKYIQQEVLSTQQQNNAQTQNKHKNQAQQQQHYSEQKSKSMEIVYNNNPMQIESQTKISQQSVENIQDKHYFNSKTLLLGKQSVYSNKKGLQTQQQKKQTVYMQIEQPNQLSSIKKCINQIQNLQFQQQHQIELISPPKQHSVQTLKQIAENTNIDPINQDDFYIPYVTEEQELKKQTPQQKTQVQTIVFQSPYRKEKLLIYKKILHQNDSCKEQNNQKQQLLLSDIPRIEQTYEKIDHQEQKGLQKNAAGSKNQVQPSQRNTSDKETNDKTQIIPIIKENAITEDISGQLKEQIIFSKAKEKSQQKRTLLLSQSSSQSEKRTAQKIN